MDDAVQADAPAAAPPETTYCTRQVGALTLVLQARWHADCTCDVAVTDGASVWHKAGA
jgi:hypothetical protein